MPTFLRLPVLRALVALLLAATVLFTAAQQFAPASPWWLELTRYLPYPVFLAPAVLAGLLSSALGRRWRVASGAALMLVAVVTMDLHWHPFAPETLADSRHLRLMTYNIKAYKALEKTNGVEALATEVALHDPDLLLMQEAATETQANAFGMTGPILGLPHVFLGGGYGIASRWPLRECAFRRVNPGRLEFLICVVEVDGIDVTVVTVHFESPRRGLVATRREGMDGIGDWQRNYAERLIQSRGLARALEDAKRPLVVAGDLNAPEASPVVGALLGLGLRDAFSAAGNGYGYSYGHALKVGFSFLRIDHILVSSQIEVVDAAVGSAAPSEHRPVIADLVLPPR